MYGVYTWHVGTVEIYIMGNSGSVMQGPYMSTPLL